MKFIKLFHTQPSELHVGGIAQVWADGDTESHVAHEEQPQGEVVSQQWDVDSQTLTLTMENGTEQTIAWEEDDGDADGENG